MSPSTKPVALVTGANKGIGFEVARAIAKSGYVVLLGARSPTSGREAAAPLAPVVEKVGCGSDRERLERSRVDHEAWRPGVEVCAREGVGILRVEGGAEHVHGPIGLRTEGSGHYGELGQSGLHGDGPECAQGSAERGGRSRGDCARRAPGAWTERKVPGNRR